MVVENNNNTLHDNKVKQKKMLSWQERKDIVSSAASRQSYFVYHINICDKAFNYDGDLPCALFLNMRWPMSNPNSFVCFVISGTFSDDYDPSSSSV